MIEPGQTWTPTRPGSRAKPRTVVWAGTSPSLLPWTVHNSVGFVRDPAKPAFPETGHDTWIGIDSFRSWIRKHQAVCS